MDICAVEMEALFSLTWNSEAFLRLLGKEVARPAAKNNIHIVGRSRQKFIGHLPYYL